MDRTNKIFSGKNRSTRFSRIINILIIIYIVTWSLNFSVILGDIVGPFFLSTVRWITVIYIYLIFFYLVIFRSIYKIILSPLLFIIFILPSCVTSADPTFSYIEFIRSLSIIFIFTIISKTSILEVVTFKVFGLCLVIICLVSFFNLHAEDILSGIGWTKEMIGRERSAGLTIDVNVFGVISATSFGYLLLFSQGFGIPSKLWTLGSITISVICVLASGSRASIYMLFIALFIKVAQNIIRKNKIPKHIIFFKTISCVILCLVCCGPLIKTIITRNDMIDTSSINSYELSNAARFILWQKALSYFVQTPITGRGFGLKINTDTDLEGSVSDTAPFAHNAMLNIIGGSGILGAIMLLIILCRCSFILTEVFLETSKVPNDYRIKAGIYFLFYVVCCIIISSIVDGGLQNSYAENAMFAFSLGNLASLIQDGRSQNRVRKRSLLAKSNPYWLAKRKIELRHSIE